MDGVVRMPSAFSITFGVLPSMTATQELVVPRSMPMTLPMVLPLNFAAGWPGLNPKVTWHPDGMPAAHPPAPPRSSPLDTRFTAIGGSMAHIGGPPRAARCAGGSSLFGPGAAAQDQDAVDGGIGPIGGQLRGQ